MFGWGMKFDTPMAVEARCYMENDARPARVQATATGTLETQGALAVRSDL